MRTQPPKRLRRLISRRLDDVERVANLLDYDMPKKAELLEELLAKQMQDPETAALLRLTRRRPSWWK